MPVYNFSSQADELVWWEVTEWFLIRWIRTLPLSYFLIWSAFLNSICRVSEFVDGLCSACKQTHGQKQQPSVAHIRYSDANSTVGQLVSWPAVSQAPSGAAEVFLLALVAVLVVFQNSLKYIFLPWEKCPHLSTVLSQGECLPTQEYPLGKAEVSLFLFVQVTWCSWGIRGSD